MIGITTLHVNMASYYNFMNMVFGLPSALLKYFLRGRRFCVTFVTAHSALVAQGIPHGSVLSATLFAVAINAITSSFPDSVSNSL